MCRSLLDQSSMNEKVVCSIPDKTMMPVSSTIMYEQLSKQKFLIMVKVE